MLKIEEGMYRKRFIEDEAMKCFEVVAGIGMTEKTNGDERLLDVPASEVLSAMSYQVRAYFTTRLEFRGPKLLMGDILRHGRKKTLRESTFGDDILALDAWFAMSGFEWRWERS